MNNSRPFFTTGKMVTFALVLCVVCIYMSIKPRHNQAPTKQQDQKQPGSLSVVVTHSEGGSLSVSSTVKPVEAPKEFVVFRMDSVDDSAHGPSSLTQEKFVLLSQHFFPTSGSEDFNRLQASLLKAKVSGRVDARKKVLTVTTFNGKYYNADYTVAIHKALEEYFQNPMVGADFWYKDSKIIGPWVTNPPAGKGDAWIAHSYFVNKNLEAQIIKEPEVDYLDVRITDYTDSLHFAQAFQISFVDGNPKVQNLRWFYVGPCGTEIKAEPEKHPNLWGEFQGYTGILPEKINQYFNPVLSANISSVASSKGPYQSKLSGRC